MKVNVWGGISCRGATALCIFEGIMDKCLYTEILEKTLLPFIHEVYPFGHRFMQDNDPKHTSLHTRAFLQDNHINWMRTPAESPDANPIENLWHEMKEYNRREVKPTTKAELIKGLQDFWNLVDINKCNKYIRHLRKVIPRIIELNGDATGY